ncbi:hypothetical protein GSI_12325 [Ganoderma sinense ZZ0214-1]|uniref:Uncharacterized protein n=1 Tax=Ganoderma sinense ZZ0214-1 TaxID=1077348 RepID=A0A2G8RYK6_9APHY|nr:hypothetical protein GSI_12325 [Ganoderma sinense ZZ0214-1]
MPLSWALEIAFESRTDFPSLQIQIAGMSSVVHLALGCYFAETLLCGCFIALYAIILWQLFSKRLPQGRSRRDMVLIGASAAMFLLAILHLAVDSNILVASGLLRGVDIPTLAGEISMWNGPKRLGFAKFTIYVGQTFIGDSFMTYRAFIIWNSSWLVIAFPLVLLAAELALGSATIALGQLAPWQKFHTFMQIYFVISVTANVLVTALVMRPLLSSRRGVQEYRPEGSRLRTVKWRVAESIIQSAAVLTISAVSFAVTAFASPAGFSVCHYIFPPVVGMVFSITVARICLSAVPEAPRPSMLALEGNYDYGPGGARTMSCPSLPVTVNDVEDSDCAAHPIAIHVSVTHTSDRDSVLSSGQYSTCGSPASHKGGRGEDEKGASEKGASEQHGSLEVEYIIRFDFVIVIDGGFSFSPGRISHGSRLGLTSSSPLPKHPPPYIRSVVMAYSGAPNDPMATMTRSTLASGIAAFFVESLLFGAFAVTYGICTWILLFRDRGVGGSTRNVVLFSASSVIFVLALVHMALDLHVLLDTFVARGGDLQTEASVFDDWNALSNTLGAAKFGIYVTQVLVGDSFMAYRAYIVWDRSVRVVVLPAILLFGEVVIGYYISFSGPIVMKNLQTDVASCVDALVQAFFILSAVTNLLSTGLIMKRILTSSVGSHDVIPRALCRGAKWRVFESILQSAAIYSVASISLAATSFTSPTIAFPALHSVFPSVIGIVFLLIVVRITRSAPAGSGSGSAGELGRRSMHQLNGSSCQIPSLSLSLSTSTTAVHTVDVERRGRLSSPLASPIAIHVSVSTTSDTASAEWADHGDEKMGMMELKMLPEDMSASDEA